MDALKKVQPNITYITSQATESSPANRNTTIPPGSLWDFYQYETPQLLITGKRPLLTEVCRSETVCWILFGIVWQDPDCRISFFLSTSPYDKTTVRKERERNLLMIQTQNILSLFISQRIVLLGTFLHFNTGYTDSF